MKTINKFVAVAVAMSMVYAVPTYAGNTTITRDNYCEQMQDTWCWVATAENFVTALERNKSKPSTANREYNQYSVAYDVYKQMGRKLNYSKVSKSNMYTQAYNNSVDELDNGGGISTCVDAAYQYCDDKGYDHDFGFMSQTVRFGFLVKDIEQYDWPYGLYLYDKSSSGGVNSHMVLACGVDNTKSRERVTVFDPADGGTYVTLAYDDLIEGSSAFDGLKYTGSVYCDD